jgi:hypothetical protein
MPVPLARDGVGRRRSPALADDTDDAVGDAAGMADDVPAVDG